MRDIAVAVFTGVFAMSLASCSKQEEQMGLTNWEKAPPLLAGVDQGAVVVATDGGPNPAQVGPTAPAAPGVTAAAAPAAAPGSVPVRKAGLWQTTVNSGRGQPQTGTLCVDEQSELARSVFAQAGAGGRGGQGCAPKIARGTNGAWTATMTCTRSFGDSTVRISSTQTLTGDLNTRYQLKGTTTTSGSPNPEMDGTRNITASGVYQGPCPAGKKPGDFTGSDGETRNILQGGGGLGGGRGERGGRREGGARSEGGA